MYWLVQLHKCKLSFNKNNKKTFLYRSERVCSQNRKKAQEQDWDGALL